MGNYQKRHPSPNAILAQGGAIVSGVFQETSVVHYNKPYIME
jgi:hypothetical protein